jgi:molecular chaperone GrpE
VSDTQKPSASGTGDLDTKVETEEEEVVSDQETADPLAEAEARAQEYLELAQRKQAEFENFRKRMSAQAAQAEERGIARMAKELLAPLDHLRLAVEHADDEHRPPLDALHQEFLTALGRLGVVAFAPLGEAFDPTEHEAVAQHPVEGAEPGTVAEVFQTGYRIDDTILRPARVVVAQ